MEKLPDFDAVAVARLPLDPSYGQLYQKWLAAGYGDNLPYLSEPSRYAPDFGRPWAAYALVLAKSLPLSVADFPLPPPPLADPELIGAVSLYALGNDYHLVLPAMAREFIAAAGIRGRTEITVDSAAVNERALALAAGLARRGRHAGLIHDKLGTHFVLAVVFCESLPASLAAMAKGLTPEESVYPCHNCNRCQAACPVGALGAGGLDARKCLSYWTIEHRGDRPPEATGGPDWPIFGCDLCLRSCPHSHLHNDRAAGSPAAVERAREFIMGNSNKALEKILRGTAYSRARGNGLKRNCQNFKKLEKSS